MNSSVAKRTHCLKFLFFVVTTIWINESVASEPHVLSNKDGPAISFANPMFPPSNLNLNLNQYCAQIGRLGRFVNPNDSQCRSFVLCYVKRRVITGAIRNCAGSLVFDPSRSLCVISTRYECPALITPTTIPPGPTTPSLVPWPIEPTTPLPPSTTPPVVPTVSTIPTIPTIPTTTPAPQTVPTIQTVPTVPTTTPAPQTVPTIQTVPTVPIIPTVPTVPVPIVTPSILPPINTLPPIPINPPPPMTDDDVDAFCGRQSQTGYFAHPVDPTCRSYIDCLRILPTGLGIEVICSSFSHVFYPPTRSCVFSASGLCIA